MMARLLGILGFRSKLEPKPPTSDDLAIKNRALTLAQEWGKDWRQPIQQRLGAVFAQLSPAELDQLNELVQAAMHHGHDLVYTMAEQQGRAVNQALWRATFLQRYPWVDERNLRHLYSTGMYYAWKDGIG